MWTAIKNFFSNIFGKKQDVIEVMRPEIKVEIMTPYKVALQEYEKGIKEW